MQEHGRFVEFANVDYRQRAVDICYGPGIRMDTHIETGYTIPPFYDSMIGKLICWGKDRDEAIIRTLRALDDLVVDGVITTTSFHKHILESEAFQIGNFNTGFFAELMADAIQSRILRQPG